MRVQTITDPTLRFRVGLDIGGTFADLAVYGRASGEASSLSVARKRGYDAVAEWKADPREWLSFVRPGRTRREERA
jgi:hypothetical protein